MNEKKAREILGRHIEEDNSIVAHGGFVPDIRGSVYWRPFHKCVSIDSPGLTIDQQDGVRYGLWCMLYCLD